jgi:hypothetical protein
VVPWALQDEAKDRPAQDPRNVEIIPTVLKELGCCVAGSDDDSGRDRLRWERMRNERRVVRVPQLDCRRGEIVYARRRAMTRTYVSRKQDWLWRRE